MFRTLEVTSAASVTKLTTLAQLKEDGGYDNSQDTLLNRVLEVCSNEIAHYLRDAVDEDEDVTLGRETLREKFYSIPLGGVPRLQLARRPVGDITSVTENNSTINRIGQSGSDGTITATETTFTSASATFTESYVGETIVVTGAGASGADLTTTVSSFTDANTIELTDAAGTTVSGDAAWTLTNPAFNYVVRKPRGELIRRIGNTTAHFLTEPITVVYTAGWLLPGETGRNLPYAIETACIQYVRKKLDQLQEGQDFSGPLTAASVDGVGSFQFGSGSFSSRGWGIPLEIRATLDKFKEPVFA